MSSTRFAYGPGSHATGRPAVPESTTSYDSRSEEGRLDKAREAHDVMNSSRDVTRDTSDRDDYVPRGEVRYVPRAETSTDTDPHGSYDFRYPAYAEKVEWSCDEAGGWQKLSFLFLVLSFLGHSIAVCTPYWVVGYLGDQMSLYEGVWLSCYREEGVGRWVCSNYDTIRKLFEQPPWYEASQICAVLSVILQLPALVAATLYSYVVSLSGRSRASWILLAFLGATAFCSFLSFVVYGAGYPLDQDFPPGSARLHASFGLQIVSFLFCCVALGTHLKDSLHTLRTWDNNNHTDKAVRTTGARSFSPSSSAPPPPPPPSRGPYVTSGRVGDVRSSGSSHVPKLPSFSMPKFPSALSRFRSREGGKTPTAPPPPGAEYGAGYPGGREASGDRAPPAHVSASGAPSQRAGGGNPPPTYRSYAPSSGGGSVSGYDSQV